MKPPQFEIYFLPFRFGRAIREVVIITFLFFLFFKNGITAFESAMLVVVIWITGMLRGILMIYRKKYREHVFELYRDIEELKRSKD